MNFLRTVENGVPNRLVAFMHAVPKQSAKCVYFQTLRKMRWFRDGMHE